MAGTDYAFTDPLTVTFDYGASKASVPLIVYNADSIPTADRTIFLQLQNPVGGFTVDGKEILEVNITDNGMPYFRQTLLGTVDFISNT